MGTNSGLTMMQLHHAPEVIKADYEASEALGLALLACADLGCLAAANSAPAKVLMIHTWTRKTNLLTGAQTFEWVTEAA